MDSNAIYTDSKQCIGKRCSGTEKYEACRVLTHLRYRISSFSSKRLKINESEVKNLTLDSPKEGELVYFDMNSRTYLTIANNEL